LLGLAILVLCAIGFAALWKRRRTLVAFDLFLLGFAFTLFVGLLGFVFILVGGWLMLRAWRLNKYGTTNTKAIAREAAARPRGRQRKEETRTASKAAASPGARKPPTASKRYTPKAPPRKKIPKAPPE
jgi:type VI protein secretion system component VasK